MTKNSIFWGWDLGGAGGSIPFYQPKEENNEPEEKDEEAIHLSIQGEDSDAASTRQEKKPNKHHDNRTS